MKINLLQRRKSNPQMSRSATFKFREGWDLKGGNCLIGFDADYSSLSLREM
jgi:hypothetical protein